MSDYLAGGQETTIAVPRCERQQRDGMSDNPPELWDIDRVCAYLGCSKHLVYRLTREHRIRFVRVGKELRFRSADVAAWLEAESVPAGAAESERTRDVVDAPVTGIGPHESQEVAAGRTASSVAQRHRHL